MASLAFSHEAMDSIARLPRDAELLSNAWRQLELAAEDPEFYTVIPPPFPHRQDRRHMNFRVEDSAGVEWAFSVLFAEVGTDLFVTRFDYNKSEEYPDSGTDPE